MRLLALDIESTGFDFKKDRIIEVGFVLYDAKRETLLWTENALIHREGFPESSKSALDSHKITSEILIEFGQDPSEYYFKFLSRFVNLKVDFLVGHNIRNFDKPFLVEEMLKENLDPTAFFSKGLIDTQTDLLHDKEPDSRKLKYMAADRGYINPFPHRAIFDALSCLKLLEGQDLDKVLAQSLVPLCEVEAIVSFDKKDLAKARGFRWKPETKKWVKSIKKNRLEFELEGCGFETKIVGESVV